MARVSFDFDGCLERRDVQEMAKTLIRGGNDVWIVTSRWDEDNKHKYQWKTPEELEVCHDDLYSIANQLGIRDKILFTNMAWKVHTLLEHEFELHFDDTYEEIEELTHYYGHVEHCLGILL